MTIHYLPFQLDIYKHGLELELGTFGFRVEHSTTLSEILSLYFLPPKVSSSDFRLFSAAGDVTSLSTVTVACIGLPAMSDWNKEKTEFILCSVIN